MEIFGRSTISEFLDDRVVYRNLAPFDTRLPGLDDIREIVSLDPGIIPRKSQPEYAQVIVHILREAHQLDAPGKTIERLVFVGDTRLNDGTAFDNLCRAGGWDGLAFIGSENQEPAKVDYAAMPGGGALYLANRWSALADFDRYCSTQGFVIDVCTAVIVDLDKTALGARGRNAHVIDRARMQAVEDTVAGLLGETYNPSAFQSDYDLLNQVEFHPFTTDNQDYLAYICLILGSGLFDLEALVADIKGENLKDFRQFIEGVDESKADLPPVLAGIHSAIYAAVKAGDPTPFKAFRRNEYLTTIERMGRLSDGLPAEAYLMDEIVITQEVRLQALEWRSRGALLFGLSDKPDEASVPSPELVAQGYQPIHNTPTHVVGAN